MLQNVIRQFINILRAIIDAPFYPFHIPSLLNRFLVVYFSRSLPFNTSTLKQDAAIDRLRSSLLKCKRIALLYFPPLCVSHAAFHPLPSTPILSDALHRLRHSLTASDPIHSVEDGCIHWNLETYFLETTFLAIRYRLTWFAPQDERDSIAISPIHDENSTQLQLRDSIGADSFNGSCNILVKSVIL